MKHVMNLKSLAAALALLGAGAVQAGNPDRAGSAGATQLLLNPWARSAGWGLANTASVRGVEAMYGNIAGLSLVGKTEVMFSNTRLPNADMSVNSIGFGQKLGSSGVIGIMATTMSFGEIEITTTETPEGGRGGYTPALANIGIAYSKSFSNSIFGGILVRVISESTSNVRTSGICFDAGIHYVTGATENLHFGISLKNVGPAMQFSGDGLAVQGLLTSGSDQLTLQQRSGRFEIPSMLNIGAAYDWNVNEMHRVTFAGTFVSNSFTKDQGIVGVEYAFRKMLHIRGAYLYEADITSSEDRSTWYTGPSAGLSVDLPFGQEKKSAVAIDYAYRATNPFNGFHSVGIRISL